MAGRPSLEELLKDIPPEKLDQPCRHDHLSEIALSITRWKSIAPFLGLTKAEEENIEKDCGENETQKIGMLRKWKERLGRKATYRKLAKVFFKLERVDLVEEVCELLQTEHSSSSSEELDGPPTVKRNTLDSYADYLRGRYSMELPKFFILQWPPPPTRKVFNLAMIGHQTIQRGPIDEELVCLTLTGNADGIMRRKTSVELKDLFKLDNRNRKIILIEGAPGAGKSTLAWHICQKWESGELFQEFKVVIFAQLRDPAIQSARSLVDILPGESESMRSEVMSELLSCWGQNVLFVLDGWDEYGRGLRAHSFFQQLICEPEEVNMHFSSLIITSRPIASGELQYYSSSRIEIVGFTSAEVKRYFSESIDDTEMERKLQDHMRERPVIEASCYLPLNAAIVAHVFLALNHTLPHTLHEMFLSLVLCCIIRHLTKEADGERPHISSLDNLPPDVLEQLNSICTMAYHGVMKNEVTFSASDLQSFNLPTEFSTLSLIQGIQSFTVFDISVSYNFLHLSVQELLAAFHVSKLSATEQIRIFNDLFDQPRLAAVFQFYAAFTKLKTEGIRDIVARIVQKRQRPLLVNLLHGLYEAQDLSLCQFVASHLKGELDLHGNTLSPMDCLVVGYFLSCVCLTTSGEFKANLCNCSLDHYRVSFVIRELPKYSAVPGFLALHLSDNNIHECKVIGDALTVHTSLQVLDLYHNPISAGVVHIAKSLNCNHSLLEIHLCHCGISVEGCNAIGDALMVNRSLQILDLHDNPISAGVVHIAESLKCNRSLLEINLSRCGISMIGAESLALSLKENNCLQTLMLSGNCLSDAAAAAHIADGLRHNNCLKKLDISDCGLTDQGMGSIAGVLDVNSSLEELDLSGNIAVTKIGLLELGQSLMNNTGLKTLNLIGLLANIPHNVWKIFLVYLRKNNHLTKLQN